MKKMRYLLFWVLCCGAGFSFAQPAPEGWSRESQGGYTVMMPPDVPSGQAYVLISAPEMSLDGQRLEDWARSQGEALVNRFATPTGQADFSDNGYFYQYVQNVTVKDTAMVMSVFAIGTGDGRGQLLAVLSTPDEAVISRYTATVVKMAVAMRAEGGESTTRKSGSRTTITSSSGDNALSTSQSTSDSPYAAPPPEPWRTAAGQGLADAQIEGIYYVWDQVYGVTGLQYEHEWALLLKDGTAYRALGLPPADLDVAVSRAQQPSAWTRWRKQGGKIELEEEGVWKVYEGQTEAFQVKPARKGERLNGRYTAYSFASYGGFGGYASQDSIRFYADGRFERNDTFQAGTGVAQSLNDFSSSAATFGNDAGEYELNGYTLELRYGDGHVVRYLFFFEDEDVVIGTGLFQKDED